MILVKEALFNSLANSLLFRDRRAETLVQGLGRPGRQGGVHFRLLLAPGYFEGLVLKEHCFCRAAEFLDVLLHG